MSTRKHKRGVWLGVVSLIVFSALVLWWIAASRPLDGYSILSGLRQNVAEDTDITSETSNKAATSSANTGVKNVVRKSQDVATIIRSVSSISTFNTHFRSSGVVATINPKSSSKYTIFAPSNGAFSQLPPGTVGNMTTEEKKRLMQYHVISGRQVDPDALSTGTMTSLSGDALNFSYGIDKIPMVNSSIVVTQYEGSNGVVIVIDNVLLPPKKNN